MTLDRITIPELKLPAKVNILKAEERKLDNGLSVHVINAGDEKVVKFEIIFPICNTDSDTYINSLACHQLVDAGTIKRKALEIAEEFDFYGAFFQTDAGPDYISFSLYTLSSLFDDALKIVNEILLSASFPEEEIINWKKRNIQAHSVNSEKVSWLAKKIFNEKIFGAEHPYGHTPDIEAYEKVNRNSIQEIFKNNYLLQNSTILLSGNVTNKIFNTVNSFFGKTNIPGITGINVFTEIPKPAASGKIRIEKEDSVQSSIRIGRQLFSKKHPDYLPLLIANTILGGYFGSRLMSNLRENKGFTYGIGSGLHSYVKSGSFFISTEVGKQVCDQAVNEIYFEIQQIIDHPVTESELKLVKNYLAGSFLRSLDGPFELAERFKGLILHGLTYEYFDNYLHLLNKITPSEVMAIASKHLQPSAMNEVIVG